MGLIMGIVVHGMPLAQAFETYAILTVGDGLVSQIPAVIISIASALLLARGGATGATDLAIFGQLGRYPAALATVAVLMVTVRAGAGPAVSCRSCWAARAWRIAPVIMTGAHRTQADAERRRRAAAEANPRERRWATCWISTISTSNSRRIW